jgi:predicted  nucleic acid-binding Zn-ribbon protein
MTAQLQANNSQETLYNQDYYQWLIQTAQLLKEKEFTQLDLENLIEEIESLGKNEKRAIESNLIVVILHLLKWRYQPEKRSNSWKSSIREHRRRIQRLFSDSPSLKNHLPEILATCYLAAKKQASDETGLSILAFPEECPFSIAECLDEDFLA